MLKVKVSNMTGHAGEAVKNQFEVRTDEGVYFQSYDKVIAFRDNRGNITLDGQYWDYSTTTGKYRNLFLREDKKQTQKKIDSGEYKIANLN